MAYDPSTRAGGWVAAQAARRWRRASLAGGVGLLATLSLVATALTGGTHPLLALAILVVALAAFRIGNAILDDVVHWQDGAHAERAVGDVLNRLRPEFTVLHDVRQFGEGNVDHLVSGPSGVFMVETKARRYPPDALRKARRQAAKLGNELGVWVTPVICIHERRGREPFRHDGVWVVTRDRLADWLRAQRNATVAFERLARFADQV